MLLALPFSFMRFSIRFFDARVISIIVCDATEPNRRAPEGEHEDVASDLYKASENFRRGSGMFTLFHDVF